MTYNNRVASALLFLAGFVLLFVGDFERVPAHKISTAFPPISCAFSLTSVCASPTLKQ